MICAELLALFADSVTQPIRRSDVALPHGGHVYLRRSQRLIGRDIWPTLEVADIHIPVHARGRGHCSALFRECEIFARHYDAAVFVENVFNPLLGQALQRWGYSERCVVPGMLPCDWWKKP